MSRVGPDSRRSWTVAGACFIVQVLTFGLTEASGLLFVAVIEKFHSKREEASLPFTVAYCVRSAVGPLISYLGQRFGIRQVTLVGAIFSAFSIAACFFVDDILDLILLWGLAFGFSLGMETSLLSVVLNEHFVKHIVKANGLSISGASLGTLLFSPFIEYSVEEYGLSGTFLIISGLMLNSIPAVMVMLFNMPMTDDVSSVKKSFATDHNDMTKSGNVEAVEDSKDGVQIFVVLNGEISKTEEIRNNKLSDMSSCVNNGDCNNHNFSFVDLPSSISSPSSSISSPPSSISSPSSSISSPPLSISSPPSSSNWEIFRLFCEPIYIILVIGSGIYYFSITTFLTIIVDHATDIGISLTYSTYIVMWIAVSDMLGYFTLTYIIERCQISLTKFAAFSYLCVCLMCIAIVWSTNYIILLFLITVFEFGQCGVIVLCAPIVAELIDENLQATAIASVTILSSPITMAISPIIGYFRDGGGSYAGVFYVISAATFLCCLLFLFLCKLENRRESQRSKTFSNLNMRHTKSMADRKQFVNCNVD